MKLVKKDVPLVPQLLSVKLAQLITSMTQKPINVTYVKTEKRTVPPVIMPSPDVVNVKTTTD